MACGAYACVLLPCFFGRRSDETARDTGHLTPEVTSSQACGDVVEPLCMQHCRERCQSSRASGKRSPPPPPPRSNFGFDPLGLGKDAKSLERFRESEVLHGRWAMLGVAGCFAVELAGQGNWYDAPLWVSTPVLLISQSYPCTRCVCVCVCLLA